MGIQRTPYGLLTQEYSHHRAIGPHPIGATHTVLEGLTEDMIPGPDAEPHGYPENTVRFLNR
jgi:hypothetical protein